MVYPRLSVIVPSYNQAAYIEETLLSILGQNYPNLELMVIDGGSTDGSVEIIKKYDSHITYWVSEPDRGQSHAINKGLERATGEWVAWMNSDDCYLPGAFSKLFVQNKVPESCKFIYGNTTFGPVLSERHSSNSTVLPKADLFDILMFFKATQNIIPSQSVWINHKFLNHVGLLNESLHYCMDLDWYIRIFKDTTSEERLFYTEPLSFFRIHPQSKTSTAYFAMQQEAIELAEAYAIFIEQHKRILLIREIACRRWINKLQAKGEKPTLLELLRGGFKHYNVAFTDGTYTRMLKKSLKSQFLRSKN